MLKVILGVFYTFISLTALFSQSLNEAFVFRGNSQLTGVAKSDPIYSLKGVKFTFKTEGAIRSTPAVFDGLLYFGSGDGNFYAIDAQTGKEKWRIKTGGAINSSPAIFSNNVYFASRDGYIYAINSKSGKENWKFKMGKDLTNLNYWDYYLSSPNIENGKLYIGSGDGFMYSLDAKTGKLNWKYNTSSRIRTTPAVGDQSLVFGTMDGHVYSLDKNTGKFIWKFITEGAQLTFESGNNDRTSIYCSPSIDKNTVVIGGRDGKLYALELKTGLLKWKTPHDGGAWILSTGIKDGKVYAGSGSAFMLQITDQETGKELWRYKTRAAIFSSIVLIKDMIYFNDRSGNVYGLDHTGNLRWRFAMGSMSFSTPVVVNGVVYSCSDNGTLFALQAGDESDVVPANPTKVVFWEPAKTDTSFQWFQNHLDIYFKNYFVRQRYQLVNADKLKIFLEEAIRTKKASVVVFANHRVPATVLENFSGKTLIRKYLDAGGKVVFLSDNPVSYVIHPITDKLDTIDYSRTEKMFDITFPPIKETSGFYNAVPTEAGKRMGLRDHWTNFGVVSPGSNTEILAKDEFDQAAIWLKNYGGPRGSGLLQLQQSRSILDYDLDQLINLIEFGIDW